MSDWKPLPVLPYNLCGLMMIINFSCWRLAVEKKKD